MANRSRRSHRRVLRPLRRRGLQSPTKESEDRSLKSEVRSPPPRAR
jgi:hypothetical protein